jgi:hypothetical protein
MFRIPTSLRAKALVLPLVVGAIALPAQSAMADVWSSDPESALIGDVLNQESTIDYYLGGLETDLLTSCLYYNICPGQSALAGFEASTLASGEAWGWALGPTYYYYCDPYYNYCV